MFILHISICLSIYLSVRLSLHICIIRFFLSYSSFLYSNSSCSSWEHTEAKLLVNVVTWPLMRTVMSPAKILPLRLSFLHFVYPSYIHLSIYLSSRRSLYPSTFLSMYVYLHYLSLLLCLRQSRAFFLRSACKVHLTHPQLQSPPLLSLLFRPLSSIINSSVIFYNASSLFPNRPTDTEVFQSDIRDREGEKSNWRRSHPM